MTWPTIPPILLSSFKLGAGSRLQQAPDGSQALLIGNGSSSFVDLGITPAELQAYPLGQSPYVREGIYTLAFDALNYFPKYPADYDLDIAFGTQKLVEVYGWGKADWTTVTSVFPGPGYIVIDKSLPGGGAVQGAKNLVITITTNQWMLFTKNFSLIFTPTN